jgi:multiple sugar transport system substrate-binding protein
MKKILFLLTILTMMFSACTPSTPGTTSPEVEEPIVAPVEQKPEATEAPEASLEGTTITVMLPPWGELPEELLAVFEESTGITVDMQIVGWDEIHNKIAVASAGNIAAADVIEVDWSWVGEFNSAGWFTPLNDYISEDMYADIPLIKTFTAQDNVVAVPWINDFRVGTYNKTHLEEAGIEAVPRTWDELLEASIRIKEAGIVEYPMGFPLSVSEATTTNFILITLSRSGDLFNEDGTLNEENALSTMQFMHDALNVHKVVNPNTMVMIDREIMQQLIAGAQTFMMAWPGVYNTSNNPESSKVVGNTARMLVPGREGVRSASFGLPEGLGIPVYSKNKEAAWKFIEWVTSPEGAAVYFETQGLLPPRTSVFSEYVEQGKVDGGDILLEEIGYIQPFSKSGLPGWYPKFSLVVQESVNKVASGTMTPEAAVEAISTTVRELITE